MKIIWIFFLLWNLYSCKPPNNLHWSLKQTVVSNDSISITYHKDSSHIDTIRYMKKNYYEEKTPRTLKGKWYLVTLVVLAVLTVILLKN